MGPFDRFNDRAKRVLALAQDEAIRLGHNYIGTEHLLLGLVREGDSVAARALASMGVDLSKVRTAVEFVIGRNTEAPPPTEITLSPRTKKAIELAIDESRKLGADHVGPEHLLLGLVREGEGIASGVLESLGVSLAALRERVIAILGGHEPRAAPPSAQWSVRMAQTVDYPRHASRPFDRFDDHAKHVMALAQDEAIRMNHNYIGVEHLLVGLVRETEDASGRVLAGLGLDLAKARDGLERAIGRGQEPTNPSDITITPRTKKVFELAIDEARKLDHPHVGTEHLLLALVREAGSVGAHILVANGIALERVREATLAAIGKGPPEK